MAEAAAAAAAAAAASGIRLAGNGCVRAVLNPHAGPRAEGAILSPYPLKEDSRKVWIITEADRTSTCLLLPEEY